MPKILITFSTTDYTMIVSTHLSAAGFDVYSSKMIDNQKVLTFPKLELIIAQVDSEEKLIFIRELISSNPCLHKCKVLLVGQADIPLRIAGSKMGFINWVYEPFQPEEIVLKANKILQRLNNPPTVYSDIKTNKEKTLHHIDYAILNAACEIIKNNGARRISIEELAKMLGSNKKKLNSLFHREFKCTASQWARNHILKKAFEQLHRQQRTVQSISDELGFSSPTNFSTQFKRLYKFSPSKLI